MSHKIYHDHDRDDDDDDDDDDGETDKHKQTGRQTQRQIPTDGDEVIKEMSENRFWIRKNPFLQRQTD